MNLNMALYGSYTQSDLFDKKTTFDQIGKLLHKPKAKAEPVNNTSNTRNAQNVKQNIQNSQNTHTAKSIKNSYQHEENKTIPKETFTNTDKTWIQEYEQPNPVKNVKTPNAQGRIPLFLAISFRNDNKFYQAIRTIIIDNLVYYEK